MTKAASLDVSAFTALADAPRSLAGKSGQGLKVNAAANALEFGMQRPRCYRTEHGGEALGSILVTNGSLSLFYTVYYLQLGPLKAGDIIDADAACEIRNNLSYGAEIMTAMLLSNVNNIPIEYQVDPGGTTIVVGNFSGFNIKVDAAHYHDTPKIGKIEVPVDYSDAWLHYRVRARSSDANNSGYVDVMAGLGHMSALVYPKSGG